ncbi:YigZ family protein [Melioribacteraceae bacterium 4301-Me]|uniref:IMPACT family protein n=1 Tax=Pyranulibacter aquaticus TaxID=3163344 RepID=UPI0035995266
MIDKIKVIKRKSEFKYKEKGSTFIGIVLEAETEDKAIEFLNNCKKNYYDASHICYSYKISPNTIKYSDANEPRGTAGIRILNAINHFGLTNIILIVVRYFGGIKLGVGNLGKAYYHTAMETIKAAGIIEKKTYKMINVEFEFEETKLIHHILNKYNTIIEKIDYTPKPKIHFLIQPSEIESLKKDLDSSLKLNYAINESNKIVYR